MKIIYTKKGEEILVDDEDYVLLNRHTWGITNHGYARTSINQKHILMHKLILPTNNGNMVTDHINRNKIDNRKENLRIISRSENNYNHSQKPGLSKYMGVYAKDNGKYFYASISHKNKTIYLGHGDSKEDSAKLRDYATWLLRKEIGVYNFPDYDYSNFDHHKKEEVYNKLKKFL